MMAEETSLRKMLLDGNDLSLVPAEHLARGVNRLQEVPGVAVAAVAVAVIAVVAAIAVAVARLPQVDLCGTKLTELQVTTIFLDLLTSTRLQVRSAWHTANSHFGHPTKYMTLVASMKLKSLILSENSAGRKH